MSDHNNLYLDIETTGLSPETSHLTVIGTAFSDESGPVIRQFVCRRPTDEKKVLHDFVSYAGGFTGLIHFNGASFDIPYLRKKLSFYRIPDPFYDYGAEDLYRIGKRFCPLFQIDSATQKSFESFFSFPRTDRLSGGDCVRAYRQYLRTGDPVMMEKLLLHNKEDLLGMIHIRKALEGFLCLTNGDFEITDVFTQDSKKNDAPDLVITLRTAKPFLKRFSFSGTEGKAAFSFFLQAEGRSLSVTLPGAFLELKYFFENYRDYYYLPAEGRAIHKSVGRFTDPLIRKKATRETAFEPVAAVFYPQRSPVIQPACRFSPGDKISWFRAEDMKNTEDLKQVIKEITDFEQ